MDGGYEQAPAQAYMMRGNIVYGAEVVSDPPTSLSDPNIDRIPWDFSASSSLETMTPSNFILSTGAECTERGE